MIKLHALLGTLMLFSSITIFATVRTVSNNPSTLAQFSSIQAAIDASSNGDTVYVHGSPVVYPTFIVDGKAVVIIGPGWAPDKNLPLTAQVLGATIKGLSGSGTEFNGLVFTSTVRFEDGSGGTNNIRMIRNEFKASVAYGSSGGSVSYVNHLYEGCYFNSMSIFPNSGGRIFSNFLFLNNIFRNFTMNTISQTSNFLFDHNVFYSATPLNAFSNCRFLMFRNNIFNKVNADGVAGSSFTFTNNITNSATNNTPWNSNGNIDAGENVANQNPQMVDQASVDSGTDNPLLNLTIAAGPANNSALDGKDMGLLFDAVGGANWSNSRNARLPRIFKMNITTPVIAPGGTISVTVDANKSN
jgi:hypothetical protein